MSKNKLSIEGISMCIMLFFIQGIFALDNGLQLTPAMGFSTWNYFGKGEGTDPWGNTSAPINESTLKEIINAMVDNGLRDAGYVYVNYDDCWAMQNRDAYGGYVPNPTKFPEGGLRGLIDYAHSRGMKFGLYGDSGPLTCAKCMQGSLGFEDQDADSLIAWGVDYFKYDFCNRDESVIKAEDDFVRMRDALLGAIDRAAGQSKPAVHIVYSLCNWGHQDPWLWGADIGNSWRTWHDIKQLWDGWFDPNYGSGILDIVDHQEGLWKYGKPGAFNDADMLVNGLLEDFGNGLNEERAHFALWCMFASPLILGCDVRNMKPGVMEIVTNKALIDIDQDSMGIGAQKIFDSHPTGPEDNRTQVWARPLHNLKHPDKVDWAVAFFNRSNSPKNMAFTPENMAAKWNAQTEPGRVFDGSKTYYTMNVWDSSSIGQVSSGFTLENVGVHDVVVIRLSEDDFTSIPVRHGVSASFKPVLFQGIDDLHISTGDTGPVSISLFDTKGARVMEKHQASSTSVTVPTQSLKRGVHIVKIRTKDNFYSQQVLIK